MGTLLAGLKGQETRLPRLLAGIDRAIKARQPGPLHPVRLLWCFATVPVAEFHGHGTNRIHGTIASASGKRTPRGVVESNTLPVVRPDPRIPRRNFFIMQFRDLDRRDRACAALAAHGLLS